jgi:hypothetical protein
MDSLPVGQAPIFSKASTSVPNRFVARRNFIPRLN